MRILHTSDLHLGKMFHEFSLLEDQRYFLDFIRTTLKSKNYTALIIAGDIYDRAVPPADAVELFSSFLSSLRAELPLLHVFIIPGNHDSAPRLAFGNEILNTQNIHIVSKIEHAFTPIIIETNKGKLAFFLLPFLTAGALKNADNEKILSTQSDLAYEASIRFKQELSKSQYKQIPTILIAHLFTLEGKESESERLFLGSAEKINAAFFDSFTYVALGHLHTCQKVSSNTHYSGSPLAYAFDEAGKKKYLLDVLFQNNDDHTSYIVEKILIEPKKKTSRLNGLFDDFYSTEKYDEYKNDYLEINLTNKEIVVNPMNLLRQKFPFLLSIKQGYTTNNELSDLELYKAESLFNTKRDPVEDFIQFQNDLYGSINNEKVELFKSLLKEVQDET